MANEQRPRAPDTSPELTREVERLARRHTSFNRYIRKAPNGEWQIMHGKRIISSHATETEADTEFEKGKQ